MELVQAGLARGLRDLLPGEMIARQRMIATIQGVYELYGFVPISTWRNLLGLSRRIA